MSHCTMYSVVYIKKKSNLHIIEHFYASPLQHYNWSFVLTFCVYLWSFTINKLFMWCVYWVCSNVHGSIVHTVYIYGGTWFGTLFRLLIFVTIVLCWNTHKLALLYYSSIGIYWYICCRFYISVFFHHRGKKKLRFLFFRICH